MEKIVINKKFFILRVLTLPFKLLFEIVFAIFGSCFMTLKWLLFGGQQLYYGNNNFGGNITRLIDSNEAMIEAFEKVAKKLK